MRSFVHRGGHGTRAQKKAFDTLWTQYHLVLEEGQTREETKPFSFEKNFPQKRPLYIDIGFGSGQSLLTLAIAKPHCNFIGIEVHKPSIGKILLGLQEYELTNVRLYQGDAVHFLEKEVPLESLTGVQIFFPDPWPKRRHHTRRLIQKEFVHLIANLLKEEGTLHIATDWQDYAKGMMQVLSQEKKLVNLFGVNAFAPRSPHRPLLTKFECRALLEHRAIWDLQFTKRSHSSQCERLAHPI